METLNGRVNARWTNHEDKWLQSLIGIRARIEYPDDKSSFTAVTQDLFLPPATIDYIYGSASSTVLSSTTCLIMSKFCPDVLSANNFTDELECSQKMESSLPLATVNTAGLSVVDGNSTACRHLHSSLALSQPELHCPHLSLAPMEDIKGQTKCSKSNNFSLEDSFSFEDFTLFRQVAQSAGLPSENIETAFFKPLNLTGTVDRQETPTKDLIQGLLEESLAPYLPSGLFACHFYLTETQNVKSEQLPYYWLALVLFWAFFRSLAFLILRQRTVKL